MRGKLLVSLVAVCALLAGRAPANTGTVDLQYVNYTPGLTVGIHLDGVRHSRVGTGVYNLRLRPLYDPAPAGEYTPTGEGWGLYPGPEPGTSALIATFCCDVHQYVPPASAWTTYEMRLPQDAPIGDDQPPMGTEKAANLRRLFAAHNDAWTTDSAATNNLLAAAFQLCAWEIIYETQDPFYSVSCDQGSFYATDSDSVADQANAWLEEINGAAGPAPDIALRVLSNPFHQDYAIMLGPGGDPVPEPLTILGVFLGVGGVAGYLRKRRMA